MDGVNEDRWESASGREDTRGMKGGYVCGNDSGGGEQMEEQRGRKQRRGRKKCHGKELYQEG